MPLGSQQMITKQIMIELAGAESAAAGVAPVGLGAEKYRGH